MRGATPQMEERRAISLTSAEAKNTFRYGNAEQRLHSQKNKKRIEVNLSSFGVLLRPEYLLSCCSCPLFPLPLLPATQLLSKYIGKHILLDSSLSLSLNILSISFLCSVTLTCSLWYLPSPSLVSQAFLVALAQQTLSTSLFLPLCKPLAHLLGAALSYVHFWVSITARLPDLH